MWERSPYMASESDVCDCDAHRDPATLQGLDQIIDTLCKAVINRDLEWLDSKPARLFAEIALAAR